MTWEVGDADGPTEVGDADGRTAANDEQSGNEPLGGIPAEWAGGLAGNGASVETASVLCVDDEPEMLELIEAYLNRGSESLTVETVTSPTAGLDRLGAGEIDCIVSDYQMPEIDGLEFLDAVREDHPDVPFILFTGKGSEAVAERAISAGVTDYIQKGRSSDTFAVLVNRVENAIDQYRAEREAHASDRRIRRIFERVTDGFLAIDRDWRLTYVNSQAASVLDRDGDGLLGDVVWEALPELEETGFESALREAMARQEPTTVEEYNEALSMWFEFRAYPTETGLSVYCRDVSERKERERRYEAIFNQTYQFTGLMLPDGTLIEANETALEFGGIDRDDVVGEKLWETYWFQVSEETREQAKADVERAAGGEFVRRELAVQGADRTAIIDFSIKPVTDELGEVELLVPEGRDITELTERERELQRQTERFQEFASVVTHELRSTLSVLQGNLELAGTFEDREDQHVQTAERTLGQMDRLIDDFRGLASAWTAVEETTTVDLDAASERAWTTVTNGAEPTNGTLVSANAPQIAADATRLQTLLESLFRNALDHGGDDVAVEVGAVDEGFFVADDGPGIPADDHSVVFRSGYTTSDGTGFGLAIAEAVAEAHGWEITATESDRGGARFEVTGVEAC